MGSASTLWAKAEQNAGNTVKDLKFDEDLGSTLDDLDRLVDQFLFDQESLELACEDSVAQRCEVMSKEFI